jgi:DNA-binding beta-propeller fold protein YncE
MLAKRAKAIERSLSASATVGQCLEFNSPSGVAVASDGGVYVSDFENNRIQKFTSAGVFVTRWGTKGTGDVEFYQPVGVAVAPGGSVFVTDWSQGIQKFTSAGVFVNKWGSEGSSVAVASDGSVYVADTDNNRIQKFAPGPSLITSQPVTGGPRQT